MGAKRTAGDDDFRRYRDLGWRLGNLVFPDEHDPLHPSWLEPLDLVAKAVAGNSRFRFFDPADFMIMNQVLRRSRPTLTLYKHYYTRLYLNLDGAGHAYRYIAPRDWLTSTHDGRYLPYRNLTDAIDHLELWYLPWMKGGLEHERQGLDYDDAWQLDPRRRDRSTRPRRGYGLREEPGWIPSGSTRTRPTTSSDA